MNSFIVSWWSGVIRVLLWLSPFQLLSKILPSRLVPKGLIDAAIVDAWAIGHFLAAIVTWVLVSGETTSRLPWCAVGYGFVRVFELVIYHIYQLFVHPEMPTHAFYRSYRRTLLLTMHNFAEVLFWFAGFYRFFSSHFSQPRIVATVDGSIYYAAVTMTTLGYGDIYPVDAFGRCMVVVHIFVFLFLTLVVLARFVSLLPRLKSKDPTEQSE